MYYDVKEPRKHAEEKQPDTDAVAVCIHEVHKSGHTHRESTMVRKVWGPGAHSGRQPGKEWWPLRGTGLLPLQFLPGQSLLSSKA